MPDLYRPQPGIPWQGLYPVPLRVSSARYMPLPGIRPTPTIAARDARLILHHLAGFLSGLAWVMVHISL